MPGSWSDFLKLRSGPAPPPSSEAGAVRVYADAGGALRAVQSDGTDAPVGGGGGSLPTNVDWDENDLNIHEASDSGPLTPSLFRLKTLLASGLQLSVRVAAFFTDALTTYNDNGDPLLESDPLANAGAGEVRVGGTTIQTFPVTLADGETFQFAAAVEDADTKITLTDSAGVLQLVGTNADGDGTFVLDSHGGLLIHNFAGDLSTAYAVPLVLPEIPATPGPQDVTDALLALGLVTQAAP